jgi:uncharacterized protein YunC (DUF1805 family)
MTSECSKKFSFFNIINVEAANEKWDVYRVGVKSIDNMLIASLSKQYLLDQKQPAKIK